MNIKIAFFCFAGALALPTVGIVAQKDDGHLDFQPLTIKTSSCQTVYHGYTNDFGCAEITVEATGGAPPYRYRWQTGQTEVRVRVCPETTTLYYVTVTDARDREMMAVAAVEVVDVRCGPNLEGISVCSPSPDQTGKEITRCVARDVIAPLLAAGARLGACNLDVCEPGTLSPTSPSVSKNYWAFETLESRLAGVASMRLYPNPAREVVFIVLDNFSPGPFTLTLFNNIGSSLLIRKVELNGPQTFFLNVYDLIPGAYWLRLEGRGILETQKLIVAGRG